MSLVDDSQDQAQGEIDFSAGKSGQIQPIDDGSTLEPEELNTGPVQAEEPVVEEAQTEVETEQVEAEPVAETTPDYEQYFQNQNAQMQQMGEYMQTLGNEIQSLRQPAPAAEVEPEPEEVDDAWLRKRIGKLEQQVNSTANGVDGLNGTIAGIQSNAAYNNVVTNTASTIQKVIANHPQTKGENNALANALQQELAEKILPLIDARKADGSIVNVTAQNVTQEVNSQFAKALKRFGPLVANARIAQTEQREVNAAKAIGSPGGRKPKASKKPDKTLDIDHMADEFASAYEELGGN